MAGAAGSDGGHQVPAVPEALRGVAGGGDEAAAGHGRLPAAAGGAGLPRGGEHAGEGRGPAMARRPARGGGRARRGLGRAGASSLPTSGGGGAGGGLTVRLRRLRRVLGTNLGSSALTRGFFLSSCPPPRLGARSVAVEEKVVPVGRR